MGNCWSSCKSPRSPVMRSPHHHGNITSLSPPTGSSPPPPHHGSITVLSPSTGSALPPPPMDAVESIRRMYEKIDPVEKIDLLIRFVENQLDKINTQSKGESSSSSSENRLETVGDWTDVAARTIDTISTEAEKLSKSDAVKAMGSLTLKVMKGVGELHWVFIGLSVAAFALESYVRVGSTENECLELLLKIVDLAKDVKKYSEQLPDEKEKLCTAVGTIVEGVVICHDYLKRRTFFRFWSATTVAAQLDKTNQQLRDVRDSLGFSVVLRLLKQATRRPEQSPLELLDFQPVGIENQVEEVKKLLDMEGAESALAVVVCGFGGIGKSTLAASVVQSLDWASTVFKFCSVRIDEKAYDKTSHIVKLQKDITYNLGGVKLDLQDANQGRNEIKKALREKCVLLFIDNVVDKDYIQQLLPKDLSSGEQKTKLRILVTSREKNLKAELNIMCKEYDGNVLSDEASESLLLQTIIQGEAVDDMDLDERRLISEVAVACRGVPLLLSVFGKHLRVDRDKHNYQEALHVLKEVKFDNYRDEDLGEKLMFVYRRIKDVEAKEAFLDICSYFQGWKWNLVADIVDSSTLEDLRRRMLVSKSGSGEVIVHDILRLMGMKEARLNRFSNYTEFSDAMEDHLDGSGNVKGISVVGDKCSIKITQLEAMRQSLRVLMIGDWVTLEGSPSPKAFTNLRYLRVGDITALPFKDPFKLDKLRVLVNRSKPGMNLFHENEENKERAITHALLHGKCMEVNSANRQLVERSSLFAGLEEGSTATVALIMLPVNIRTEQHQTLKRFVERAREKAKSNGSGKLQIVCARKSGWTCQRATATEEEERAEEEGIRQILLSLPKGSCAIPSCQSKRVKILSASLNRFLSDYRYDFFIGDVVVDFFIGDVVVDMEGSKRFEDLKFITEDEMRAPEISEPKIKQSPSQSKSIQNFVYSIYDRSESAVTGQSKRREFVEALKGEGIHYLHLHIDNNTTKTLSEIESSSSDGWLETVQNGTKLAAKAIDTICTEAEKLSDSDAMRNVTLKVLEGVEDLHWVFIGLSVAAYAVENYLSVGSTENECREILLNILELANECLMREKNCATPLALPWRGSSSSVTTRKGETFAGAHK